MYNASLALPVLFCTYYKHVQQHMMSMIAHSNRVKRTATQRDAIFRLHYRQGQTAWLAHDSSSHLLSLIYN